MYDRSQIFICFIYFRSYFVILFVCVYIYIYILHSIIVKWSLKLDLKPSKDDDVDVHVERTSYVHMSFYFEQHDPNKRQKKNETWIRTQYVI